ncbi:RagB/SusD domain-containing protein [Hallella multisaccharivorax DSM 17128]|uniref:RagB/SusD domain-containing protein n=1 Tax=Hallella multisaccharivorax DSM 17128 TaxID=688246 RepID=F8N8R2_9BACT|nr:RagB/SusD family nutrient uptake outer membrane protein [Hallella multisaccharivorax]EGN57657.1 RagB/SusD domain-containing protein [Hallella multisaccharivorax DSM 17128]
MKLRNYIFILAMAGLYAACDDYTDLKPIDSITDASYWTSPNDLKLYANGLYGLLSIPNPDLDTESDNFVSTNYSPYLFNESTVPEEGSSNNGWYWDDIRSCNYFLTRYSKVQGNASEINKYVGEVRFFRALLYFEKIKKFGDVPWYDKDLQTSDTTELYKARDSRDVVLGHVIDDLQFAVRWLPEKTQSESGRINKDAARTELARIALYYGTYKKYHHETSSGTWTSEALLHLAKAQTDTIMDSGRYDIVKGTDAGCSQQAYEGYPLYYSDQFTQEDLSNNKECILARFYKTDVLTHELGRQVQEHGAGLSKDFAESFLMKNGMPIYNAGSGYKGDEDLDDELDGRDPRMYQIIDNNHRPYYVRNGERVHNELSNTVGSSKGVTGYECVKFHAADTKQQEARNSSYDWFVYRYAEVLLINAEANAESGTCTQTVLDKTINKLRDRVEMTHLTVNPVADARPVDYGYAVSPLLYEIRRERRIELIAEGFRMDDLKRWNAMKLLENPKTMFGIRITPTVISQFPANTFTGSAPRPSIKYDGKTYLYQYAASKALDDAGRKWTQDDRRWLYPIPTQELTLNRKLVQNPNW